MVLRSDAINLIKLFYRYPVTVITLVLGAVITVRSQSPWLMKDGNCDDVDSSGRLRYYACVGEPLSILRTNISLFNITVDPRSSTCGDTSQTFCTLGILRRCSVCDNTKAESSHPPELMLDYNANDSSPNFSTYWQSVTWDYFGGQPQVNVTLSFGRAYVMEDNIVVTFKSARPQRMLLEKSVDLGSTWTVLQYYDVNCKQTIDDGLAVRVTSPTSPDAVICTEVYSTQYPYTDGQVLFDINNDRYRQFIGRDWTDYSALFTALNSTRLPQFLTFTDLRFRLIYPATDGNEESGLMSDRIQYYYAISDINIVAGCHCNLHAKRCMLNSSGRMVCDCRHNTAGESCERCQPLYNNRRWLPGYYLPYPGGTANECQKCNCNNHSLSCTYNSGLNAGLCDSCLDNTTGNNCERCVVGFYQNRSLSLDNPITCMPCSCESLGVFGGNLTCNGVGGQCNCRSLITGRRCDVCIDQYYGLLLPDNNGTVPGTCKLCNCNTVGTIGGSNVCEKQIGQCPCKRSIESRDCSTCKDGFYSFPNVTGATTLECTDCACDPGGARTLLCHKISGQCNCFPNMIGLRCNQSRSGFFVPSVDQSRITKPSGSTCLSQTDIIRSDSPFTGRDFIVCDGSDFINFPLPVQRQTNLTGLYLPTIRYSLNGSSWPSGSLTISVVSINNQVNLSQYGIDDSATFGSPDCLQTPDRQIQIWNLTPGFGMAWTPNDTGVLLDVRCVYSATVFLDDPADIGQYITIDALVMSPDYRKSNVYMRQAASIGAPSVPKYDACFSQSLALRTRGLMLNDSDCRQFISSVMAENYQGAIECNCDNIGSLTINAQCSSVGGQCPCKTGVGGRRCEYCLPGFYNFSSTGCTPCGCDGLGSTSLVCDYDSGQCPCQPNVAIYGQNNTIGQSDDLRCRACLADYYGFSTGIGCYPCNCSIDGRNSTSGQCSDLGACSCKPTIGGNRCNRCLPGYYRFSPSGCLRCNCSIAGSVRQDCNPTTGICDCKLNVRGDKCDQCAADSFNMVASNDEGCQKCFCFGHGTQCTSAAGFQELIISADSVETWQAVVGDPMMITHVAAPASFLSDRRYSFGQWLNFTLQMNRPGAVLTNVENKLVILEGNGKRIFYRAQNLTISSVLSLVSVPLYPSYWLVDDSNMTRPDAMLMYSVLSDLKQLNIQLRFGDEYVDVRKIMLRSATAIISRVGAGGMTGVGVGSMTNSAMEPVTYVENCTCISEQNVAGLSCTNCSQGYRRSINFTRYDNCHEMCTCNDRIGTILPVCDEITSECLNCRNGTTGVKCEFCSSNVTGPDCNQCLPGYWGPTKDGCKPCQCNAIGTDSTKLPCDNSTGQCPCIAHVSGLNCDQCEDNYVNLTSSGCSACDNCYGLVNKEISNLQLLKDNLTSTVSYIVSQQRSSLIGPFYLHLVNATTSVSQLVSLLNNSQSLQSQANIVISRLTVTIPTSQQTLSSVIYPALTSSRALLASTSLELSLCYQAITDTTQLLHGTFQLLMFEMPKFTERLGQLQRSLQFVVDQLKGSSDSTVQRIFNLNETVIIIENIASRTSTLALQALQLMQYGVDQRNALQSAVTDAEALVVAVNATAQASAASANQTYASATAVRQSALTTLDQVQKMAILDVNTNGAALTIQRLKTDATNLAINADNASRSAEPFLSSVYAARSQTTSLVNQVNQVRGQSDVFYMRAQSAAGRAADAMSTAQNISSQARNMLDVMRNFDAKASDVKSQASNLQRAVQLVQDQNLRTIDTSDALFRSLSIAATNSASAKLIAQQAYNISQDTSRALSLISDQANHLQSDSSSSLNNIAARSASITTINSNILSPLSSSLNSQTIQATAIESRVLQARSAVNNVTALLIETRNRIKQLSSQLQSSTTPLDDTKITQLQSAFVQAAAVYDSLGLSTTVAGLQTAVKNQRTWIDNMKNRQADLSQQVSRLRVLRDQLVN